MLSSRILLLNHKAWNYTASSEPWLSLVSFSNSYLICTYRNTFGMHSKNKIFMEKSSCEQLSKLAVSNYEVKNLLKGLF